jgi:hypothetical protein
MCGELGFYIFGVTRTNLGIKLLNKLSTNLGIKFLKDEKMLKLLRGRGSGGSTFPGSQK